jgi:hypothetical protein
MVGPAAIQEPRPLPYRLAGYLPEGARFGPPDPRPAKHRRRTQAENTPADDPQWRALDALRDRVGLQFTAALKEAFDQIVYPSINAALRATGTDLAFAGNQNGEATLRHTLEGAQKFTTKIDDDSFRTRAEARLFGSAESKVVLWSDFKRAAAVNTNWPLHKLSALDDLKAECLRRGCGVKKATTSAAARFRRRCRKCRFANSRCRKTATASPI